MDDYEDYEQSPYDGTYSEGGDPTLVPEEDDPEEEREIDIHTSTMKDVCCPDCKSRDLRLHYYGRIREYRVECRECGSEFELGDLPTAKE